MKRDEPSLGEGTLETAVRHHQAGRLGEAKAIYESILRVQPDNADALSLLGLLAHQAGRNDVAVDLIEKAIGIRPEFAEAHLNLGNALRVLGEHDRAVEHFEKAVAIKPAFAAGYNNLGLVLQEQGRLDDSIAYFEKALLAAPAFADAHNNLGLALQKTGRTDEAIRRYRKALSFDRNFAEAHNNLGTALREKGVPDEAVACYRRALAIWNDYVEAHVNLGAALQEQGQPDGAVEHYKAALRIRPDFAEAHNSLGTACQEQGWIDDAIGSFERAVELAPDYAEAQINLANALRECERFDEAIECYERALALRPDSAGMYIDLGAAIQGQGKPLAAIEKYDHALMLDPLYADAHRNRGIAFLEMGQHENARAAFHEVLRLNHGGPWWNAPTFADGEQGETKPSASAPRASTFKLRDMIDQLDYLMAKNKLDPSFEEMTARYRAVLDEVERAVGPDGTITLSADQIARIGGCYNRVIRFADAPRVPSGAVNDKLDFAAIEESYLGSPVSITTFDDFLTPGALQGLRDFCLESTICFGYSGARFVGSDLGTGFNCSVLYQIAEDLKQRLPRVLGDHQLSNIWMYRHRNQTVGVEAHTDQGAVTFNFWITPDTANLEPGRGGLVVYAREQPYDWDWQKYNTYKYAPSILEEINDFLATAETITIPYGGNRAVLFHSNLFHKSDNVRFEEGYENRRMNITMLFGKRGAGRA